MYLRPLLGAWKKNDDFNHLVKEIGESSAYRALAAGLEGSQRNFLIASLYELTGRVTFVITGDSLRAERIYEDLLSFLPEDEVFLLPNRDFIMGEEMLGHSRETREQRMEALEHIASGKKMIFVAPVNTVLFRMMPGREWAKQVLNIRKEQEQDRENLLNDLVALGYERVPLIEGKGQFSARGDIVDIFPPGHDNPVRIELFDNTVESMRYFNSVSQRSMKALEDFSVFPAGEIILDNEIRKKGFQKIRDELSRALERINKTGNSGSADRLKEKVNQHLGKMNQNILNEAFYGYFSYFYGKGDSLLDYLQPGSLIIMDEAVRTSEAAETLSDRGRDFQGDMLVQGEALYSKISLTWSLDEIFSRIEQPCIYFTLFNTTGLKLSREKSFNFTAKDVTNYYGQMEILHNEIRQWQQDDYRIIMLSPSGKQAEILYLRLRDDGLPVEKAPENEETVALNPSPLVTVGNLGNGFFIPSLKLVIIAEQNLFPKKKKKRKLAGSREGSRLRHYNELSVGDYVVHEQHGIGKYLGVKTLEVDSAKKDYLHISYAREDKLFIPVEQIELIQKYIGVEGKAPKLHRLGSNEWNRVKSKVKASVQDLAQELLSIYAARQSLKGRAYNEHPWQAEFESYFPYEETADQLQSIKEVREDLAKNVPMDRLLCGDVGYGKTEVAMRAAFSVVMEGKQVAVLAPTTILAQQHYHTFRERFAPFPVKVALLSRFVSAAGQKETLKDISRGNVDIVIGTHRLISRDVNFKDPGLIVVDEEHRFGVRHKEKLKKLRLDVDVLTLTATPIPRTLHMAVVGARDLSLIETPPENRYPVQTYVMEYSDQVIREAIVRELGRGGQIYFVFNRVQHIEKQAKKLRELIPEARIAVAHGQMSEVRLEKIMSDFLEGNYDILLSTTIIEAGLDIPNVNTLIVYDADRFGLAQLYQLRGRVGRSNRIAYAYLTFQRDKVLTEAAEKRLQAIKEFVEFGSGYKIALRDMEIRGAGNILGPEQHGFMSEVGFELYCQLLDEAVRTYKGEEVVSKEPPRLDLKISAFLPVSYIPDQEQKIELYQRIYALDSQEEIKEVRKELVDRFGALPPEVENLLLVANLRVLASGLNINSIMHENGKINLSFNNEQEFDNLKLWRLVKQYPGRVTLASGKGVTIKMKPDPDKDKRFNLKEVESFLSLAKEVVI